MGRIELLRDDEAVKQMMSVMDPFVRMYVLVDEAVQGRVVAIPRRPGRRPACSDAEVLTVAVGRHVLGCPSQRGFLAEVRRDRPDLFPRLPAQNEFNRRVRWPWGAFELRWQRRPAGVPEDGWQQVDSTTLPVRHSSRVRRAGAWDGPAGTGLRAGFGRAIAYDLLEATPPAGLLLDRRFLGRAWSAALAERGTRVVIAHGRAERRARPAARSPHSATASRPPPAN